MNLTPIDIYCERISPDFWAEPINAITNVAFIISAYVAHLYVQRLGDVNWRAYILIGLLTAIGIGSFLFHTFAVQWAMLSDVVPIFLFQLCFIALYANDVMKAGVIKIFGIFAVFFALSYGVSYIPPDVMNGSLAYIPAALLVSAYGVWHCFSGQVVAERAILLIAAALFFISICFRSLDMSVCNAFPQGTHFIWHVLNATVLYLCVRGYAKNSIISN